MVDKLFLNQSIIISLDVDAFLFEKLTQITQAGFLIVEINSSDEALLKKILQEFPNLRIGAGNIVTISQLESCYKAGVYFASSPGFEPALAQTASVYSMNYLPGIATLSEAMQLSALGCHQARPYPASLNLCTLLSRSLPLLRLFPAEIKSDEIEHYFNFPAVAAVSILNPESKLLNTLPSGVFV